MPGVIRFRGRALSRLVVNCSLVSENAFCKRYARGDSFSRECFVANGCQLYFGVGNGVLQTICLGRFVFAEELCRELLPIVCWCLKKRSANDMPGVIRFRGRALSRLVVNCILVSEPAFCKRYACGDSFSLKSFVTTACQVYFVVGNGYSANDMPGVMCFRGRALSILLVKCSLVLEKGFLQTICPR